MSCTQKLYGHSHMFLQLHAGNFKLKMLFAASDYTGQWEEPSVGSHCSGYLHVVCHTP